MRASPPRSRSPALIEAVKRVALVADRSTPVRLEFADGGALTAGGDDEGRAEENLEVEFDGERLTIAFNPPFLLDGLGALEAAGSARLLFTTPTKPRCCVRRAARRTTVPDHAGAAARLSRPARRGHGAC